MSITGRQRLARMIRLAARITGFGASMFLFFGGFFSWTFSEGMDSIAELRFLTVAAFMALAGCIVSWWRGWLAGVLLVVSWLTFWGLLIRRITIGYYRYYNIQADMVASSPLLAAGVLFLFSWWLSRKTGP